MVALSLSEQLLQHLGDASGTPRELDEILYEALSASRAAWPGIELADADFVAYLAARVSRDAPLDKTLRSSCIPDLWLACAIERGDVAALRVFETQAMQHLGAAIAHLDGGSALTEDVVTAVRERVLGSAAGGRAKIADYRGRGDLRGWLRVVAVREALQIMRQRRREAPLAEDLATKLADEGSAVPMSPDEQRVYREAFTAALATLTPRERNMLRQQFIYGATIDELGALYGVHRATAARWIAQVRETVLRRTRRQIGEALRLSGADLDSAMGRIANHLDYSLRQTLSIEG
ncbi:MAG: putative DNA-binding regulatory protein [Myxococcales bacterium]|nr:putative DNA-binding regulatory protein [Myxococcales bacterium]